jgi:quinol monooxygenase YgiN
MQKANQNSRKVIIAAVVFLAGGCCCRFCGDTDRLLRHVVLFEFKETATAEQIEETEERFREMAEGMKEVYSFEWGTDVSDGQRTQGFTHCFILTFTSKANLDRYQADPAHDELRAATQPYIKKMLVIDYWKK